ncbi:MAG TPA: hypothetical protein VEA69_20535 [Tepidisphaeraceae bacterium]|nr:hypothetical protein [Tepidisphaeraceae bacterium]
MPPRPNRASRPLLAAAIDALESRTLFSIPAAPTDVTAVGVSTDRIDVEWRDNATDETGFVVERANKNGPFVAIAQLPADTLLYVDVPAGANPGDKFRYRVTAINDDGPSAAGVSNQTRVLPPGQAADVHTVDVPTTVPVGYEGDVLIEQPAHPDFLTPVGDDLYFVLSATPYSAGEDGQQLWKTDGNSTTLLYDGPVRDLIAPGDGSLLFVSGSELWRSDGTTAGTTAIVDLLPPFGFDPGITTLATLPNGTVLFSAGNRLWRTDGTSAGTAQIGDTPVDPSDGEIDLAPLLETVGDVLYFTGPNEFGQRSLWRSDGTEAGTFAIANAGVVTGLRAVGDTLFVAGTPGFPFFNQLSTVAPGATEATLVTELPSGPPFISRVSDLTALGDRLFFNAPSGAEQFQSALWVSDGTAEGTYPVFSPADAPFGTDAILSMAAVGDEVYFVTGEFVGGNISSTPGSAALWRSDGTVEGTVRIRSLDNPLAFNVLSVPPAFAAEVDGQFVFHDNGNLWISDGTREGTVLVDYVGPTFDPNGDQYPGDFAGAGFAVIGDRVYYTAPDGQGGRQLRWTTV